MMSGAFFDFRFVRYKAAYVRHRCIGQYTIPIRFVKNITNLYLHTTHPVV